MDSILAADLDQMLSDWGKTSTYYTVINNQSALFAVRVIVEPMQFDEIEPRFARDLMEVRIAHADLVAAGVTEPKTRRLHATSDTINIPNANGTGEAWSIEDRRFEDGMWVLTLERNVRLS